MSASRSRICSISLTSSSESAFATSRLTRLYCRATGMGLRSYVRIVRMTDRLLELCEQEEIPRFYFSHLNYAGRGNR